MEVGRRCERGQTEPDAAEGRTAKQRYDGRTEVAEASARATALRASRTLTGDASGAFAARPNFTSGLYQRRRSFGTFGVPFVSKEFALPGFDLASLGWNAELADNLEQGLEPGRVVAAHRGAFDVATAHGSVRARLPGRMLHDGVDVAVGDWVGIAGAVIRAVIPRRSAIVRSAAGRTSESQTLAANVDVAFVVSSLGPDLEPRRVERYLVTIWESGATPEIVLTKADRMDDPWGLVAEVEAVAVGVPVHVVSAVTGQGCDALRARIGEGTTAVLLGSSGVGKSTLVNRFVGRELMAVKETRVDDDEGRHTTTHRELIQLPGGGIVIDTPGLRELQLADGGSAAVGLAFSDIEALAAQCRFVDCSHRSEPGCAVKEALSTGALTYERHASWLKLQRELRVMEIRASARLRRDEKRKWQQRSREGRDRMKHKR